MFKFEDNKIKYCKNDFNIINIIYLIKICKFIKKINFKIILNMFNSLISKTKNFLKKSKEVKESSDNND